MKGTASPPRETNETDIPTQQPTAQTDTRVPRPYGHPRRPPGAQAAAGQGAEKVDSKRSAETAALRLRPDERFPKSSRIRRRDEFLRLQRLGRRSTGKCFVVITAKRIQGGSRLGITASRKVGGAVVRNRVKRLIREFFRRRKHEIV